jgi:excinuclease ABC subunit A
MVDQSSLGKTPRSNPAVYTGAFEFIREVFAQSEAAKQRGLNASAFSFNSGVGQCERCRGAGFEKIEMQFLSDVFIRCPDCNGRRYRAHILEVKVSSSGFRVPSSPGRTPLRNSKPETRHPKPFAWSIADALEASVDEAVDFFGRFTDSKPAQRAVAALKLLQDVGLGYLALGQPINTLSGGESQRLKLAAHLAEVVAAGIPACRRAGASSPAEETSDSPSAHEYSAASGVAVANPGGRMPPSTSARMADATLFIFDEPTTGLHFDDVRVLLQVFQRNLDVIKCADWVIDLGPEAGADGGQIVATGTPEDIARCEASHTGRFLRDMVGDDVRSLTSKLGTRNQEPGTSERLLTSSPTISRRNLPV